MACALRQRKRGGVTHRHDEVDALREIDREQLVTDHHIQRRGFRGKPRGSWNVSTTQDDSLIRLTFGAHKGKALPDVPTHYLVWAKRNACKGKARLADAIERELRSRDVFPDSDSRDAR